MRALFIILAGFLVFAQLVQAQNSTLPECAELCFSSAIQNSSCSATDSACLCTDASFNAQATLCVESTCTVREILTTRNSSATSCNEPVRNRSHAFTNITIVCAALSGLAVGLRVIYRTCINFSLGLDDWFIVGILFLNLSICIINVVGLSENGLGRDVWTVSFDQITDVSYYSYIVTILYFACIPLIKISILIFYHRIFISSPGICTLINATIVFNILFCLTYTFLGLFQCAPVSFYWNGWDGQHIGTCLNTVAIVNSYSGISIVVDVWMLVLPTIQIVHLNLKRSKKLAAAGMFSMGFLFTAVSAIRLAVLVPIGYMTTPNPTWDYYKPGYWSQIELTVGIICACLPSIRLLLVACFSRSSGSTQGSRKESRSASSAKPTQEWWEGKTDVSLQDLDDQGDDNTQLAAPHVNDAPRVWKHSSFANSVHQSINDIMDGYNSNNMRK